MTENEAMETLQYLLGCENAVDKGELDASNALTSQEKEALEYILEEIQKYRALGTVEELREAMEKQKWIPCSERLPEDGKDVLVWFEYFRYGNYNRSYQMHGVSYTYNGKWSGFVNGSSGWRDLNVIAWQPLPEPYKPA